MTYCGDLRVELAEVPEQREGIQHQVTEVDVRAVPEKVPNRASAARRSWSHSRPPAPRAPICRRPPRTGCSKVYSRRDIRRGEGIEAEGLPAVQDRLLGVAAEHQGLARDAEARLGRHRHQERTEGAGKVVARCAFAGSAAWAASTRRQGCQQARSLRDHRPRMSAPAVFSIDAWAACPSRRGSPDRSR